MFCFYSILIKRETSEIKKNLTNLRLLKDNSLFCMIVSDLSKKTKHKYTVPYYLSWTKRSNLPQKCALHKFKLINMHPYSWKLCKVK